MNWFCLRISMKPVRIINGSTLKFPTTNPMSLIRLKSSTVSRTHPCFRGACSRSSSLSPKLRMAALDGSEQVSPSAITAISTSPLYLVATVPNRNNKHPNAEGRSLLARQLQLASRPNRRQAAMKSKVIFPFGSQSGSDTRLTSVILHTIIPTRSHI